MTEKRFTHKKWYDERQLSDNGEAFAIVDSGTQASIICNKLNELAEENKQLKKDLRDCEKTKKKRLRRLRNQRAVLEEIGGVIIGYKGELKELHHNIDRIQERMEDTGVLTKRELEEILND